MKLTLFKLSFTIITIICFQTLIYGQGVIISENAALSLGSATLTLPNNFTNNGVFNPQNGTLVFSGSTGSQTYTDITGSALNNFSINKVAGDLLLGNNIIVNGGLTCLSGDLDLNGNVITLGSQAILNESTSAKVKGTAGYITTTRVLNAPNNEDVAGLGCVLTSTENLGSTVIVRSHSAINSGGESITRIYDISPTNNNNLNASFEFNYFDSELNGLIEADLKLYKSINDGSSWYQEPFTLNTITNTITSNNVNSFSKWTSATDINSPPTGDDELLTIFEDEMHSFVPSNFTFNDVNNDSFNGIELISIEAAGDLEYNGVKVTALTVYNDVTKLVFKPIENESGSPYCKFTFKVIDEHDLCSENIYTMSIIVTPINDAPDFRASNPAPINEDAGLQTLSNWAVFEAGFSDEDSLQNVKAYLIGNISNLELFSVAPTVSKNGTLTYTPKENTHGSSTFSVRVQDDGGTENEGIDTSASHTFSIIVNSVNDAPSFFTSDISPVNEDSGLQTIVNWASFDAGPTDEDSTQNKLGYIVSNVSNLELFSLVPTVNLDGTLTYAPAENANGSSTFDVRVQDDGGTENEGVDKSESLSFTITVISINDTTISLGIPDITINEDAPNTIVDLSNYFYDVEEDSDTLSYFIKANSNTKLFSSVLVDGAKLILDYASNMYGVSEIVIRATDVDGAFAEDTFIVTVQSVNDKPTTTGIDDITVFEDSPNSVIVLTPFFSDAENSSEELLFSLTKNSNHELFNTVSINGSDLTLDYKLDKSGVSEITIRATDKNRRFVETTFTVNVIEVNDPPIFINQGLPNIEFNEDENTSIDLNNYLSDSDDSLCNITFSAKVLEANGNSIDIRVVMVNKLEQEEVLVDTCNLIISIDLESHKANISAKKDSTGNFLVEFSACDLKNAVTSDTISVTVIPMNDPPLITALPDIITNEDESKTLKFTEFFSYVHDNESQDNSLIYVLSGAEHVELVSVYEDSVIIKPTENWFGIDTLMLTVSDGELSDKETFEFVVNSVNDLPVFVNLIDTVFACESDTAKIELWDCTTDVENSCSDLEYEITSINDTLEIDYNTSCGNLTLSTPPSYEGDIEVVIKITDADKGIAESSFIFHACMVTGLEALADIIPEKYILEQNYPNPFNPATIIRYGMPEESKVNIDVYNLLGQVVANLTNRIERAGYYEKTWNGSNVSSGVYFYVINAESIISQRKFCSVKKMLLIK